MPALALPEEILIEKVLAGERISSCLTTHREATRKLDPCILWCGCLFDPNQKMRAVSTNYEMYVHLVDIGVC